ncbi:4-hydroxybenzoate octaprenyltransferase [Kangiella spongicola]|uniref:4-hydroxybenzoate octaprenyltransferase n=1 Tax=Kangiella spongicola TaxID=796379 RepID=A0A318D5X1_9GAMM|nr:4-hydroxybenzoate octaprenyltransferase [Kangiella spongicola]PXF64253.1 4-hydroxybenzoate octaprenyltransferase [Kangiella spongicola]
MKLLLKKNHWQHYAQLMRLNKPIGTYLLLWPTLWALWIAAEGLPNWWILVVFCLGVFLMRSAGCVINDFADRDFDAHVKRTKQRPLAQDKVSSKEAITLFLVLVLMALALVLTLNWLTIGLSVIAVLLAAMYPFMKRYTYYPQAVLGAAFSWGIPMAFAAVTGEVPNLVWLLYISTLLWVLAYDTLYGMVDREDDIRLGLKSTAILFGEMDLMVISVIQGMFLFGMLLLGQQLELSFYYYCGWVVALALIARQIWRCRNREENECFNAFLNNNYVGMVLFLGLVFHYWLG